MKSRDLFLLICLLASVSSCLRAQDRTIDFSGIVWDVWGSEKNGRQYQDWSGDNESVWLDDQNRLHMKMRQVYGSWLSTAVQSKEFFGYGDYRFFVEGNVEAFHRNIDVGMFTFEYIDETEFREVDIELSRFGEINAPVGNFVMQPYFTPGNHEKFELNLTGENNYKTTYRFVWKEDSVLFQSYRSHPDDFDKLPDRSQLIHEWLYTGGDIPIAKFSNLYLNFAITGTRSKRVLSSLQESEIIFSAVRFTPIPQP